MTSGPRLVLVLLVLLATVVAPVSATRREDPDIVGVTFGNNSVDVRDNVTYVWWSDDHTITTNVTGYNGDGGYQLCASAKPPNGTSSELGCAPIRNGGNATLSFSNWSGTTGRQQVTVTVKDLLGDGGVVANQTAEVYVMTKNDDEDGDGLTNGREVGLGTDFLSVDTDEDGVEDGAEVTTYGTDPLSADTDNDGLRDGTEVSSATNATDPDTDGDGLLDGAEVNQYGTNPMKPDTDGDGLTDSEEVNQYGTDPLEPDTDSDGLSDDAELNRYETDPLEADTDGDGLTDSEEVNRYGTNPRERDTDGDGLADGTEVTLGTWPGSPLDVGLGALVGIVLLGTGVWAVRKRRTERETTAPDAGAAGPEPPQPPQPPRLESDEEKILSLLREGSGSIPQKEIVESTEWSSSKVSRLLSKMAEEGLVTKTTIGRKNYIQLVNNESEPTDQK